MHHFLNNDKHSIIYHFLNNDKPSSGTCLPHHCLHNENEVPSLLSMIFNTNHPVPREETKLSAIVQATFSVYVGFSPMRSANFTTQYSGTSEILKKRLHSTHCTDILFSTWCSIIQVYF